MKTCQNCIFRFIFMKFYRNESLKNLNNELITQKDDYFVKYNEQLYANKVFFMIKMQKI